MKQINITGLSLALGLTALLSGCQSQTECKADFAKEVELQVNVAGVGTRATLVEGTTLPDECNYFIFPMSGDSQDRYVYWDYSDSPAVVEYKNGKSTIVEPGKIILPNDSVVPVYAFFGSWPDHVREVWIDGTQQTDYLWGKSVDSDGNLDYASVSHPEVNIQFDHVMARITLNFRLGESMEQTDYYKLDPKLAGDSEGSYRDGYVNIITQEFINKDYGKYEELKPIIKDGNYGLGHNYKNDVVTCDYLVIPSETVWYIHEPGIGDGWFSLPATNYESGRQYIFNITIDKGDEGLRISIPDIVPWQDNVMPELEVEI